MSTRKVLCVIFSLIMFLGFCHVTTAKTVSTDTETANQQAQEKDDLKEWNNRIRRERFDIVLPKAMRKNNVDMWIHVMRVAIRDPFGAEDLGSTSGVFVFTDRGGDRFERAVLGRRWGATQRERGKPNKLVEESGVYDIIHDPVFVVEPVSSPMTEYDYRFKGLREFVEERDPKRIAVNYREKLGTWATSSRTNDGISHIDYLLLAEELGDKYASRLISSEYVIMDYNITPVPSEIELLKKMREDELKIVKKAFAGIKPGVTKTREVGETGDYEADVVVFRRMSTGQSQRGRSKGWENTVVEGGDIIAAPSQGVYAYVLREGETEPPPEIQRLWAEYLKIDKILAETIKAGLPSREIMESYKQKFEEEGIIVRDPQLHMFQPKNNFPAYSKGFDPEKTHLSIDCHGKGKGARKRKFDIYMGPRIGSYGPDWTWDVPLQSNHHFVLEYFFYMPSPGPEGKDQYLFFWDHEQAIATENGVEYLSPPQKELYLIK
jgi:Xaa-Pro dipeptidase